MENAIKKPLEQGRVARRRALVRANLLAAARQVFTTRGYQDATISEIIQIADVAMGTFYLHFRDKEELLLVLAEEPLNTLREQFHTAIARHANEPHIPLLVRLFLRTAYQQRDPFLLICVRESFLLTHQAQEGLARHFIPPFQEARARGEISGDPALLAHLLVGMLMQAVHWWYKQDEPGPDAMADQILSLFTHGLPSSLDEKKVPPTAQEEGQFRKAGSATDDART